MSKICVADYSSINLTPSVLVYFKQILKPFNSQFSSFILVWIQNGLWRNETAMRINSTPADMLPGNEK